MRQIDRKFEKPLNNCLRLVVAALMGLAIVGSLLAVNDAMVNSAIKENQGNAGIVRNLRAGAEALWQFAPLFVLVTAAFSAALLYGGPYPLRLPRWLFEPGPPPPVLCRCGYDLSGHCKGQHCPECNALVTRGAILMKPIKDLGTK